jgi:hypothetical protein
VHYVKPTNKNIIWEGGISCNLISSEHQSASPTLRNGTKEISCSLSSHNYHAPAPDPPELLRALYNIRADSTSSIGFCCTREGVITADASEAVP